MVGQDLIIVDVFCQKCQIEVTLLDELHEFGLIQIVRDNGRKYIQVEQLSEVQKIVQFHNELQINKEGIEVILTLLERLDERSKQVKFLQEKLRLYED